MRRLTALLLMTMLCVALAGCMPRSIDTITDAVPDQVKWILLDAKQYEVLWMRWTVTDWMLGLFAAATAIAAAVKNAFSTHQLVTRQEDQNGSTSVGVDRTVVVCALLAVVATTLDSKMHAAQTAERYRQGDLLLQEAIMDYRLSTAKEPEREQNLLAVWHQAQRILEGAPAVAPPAMRERDAPAATREPGSEPPDRPATTP